MTVVGAVFAAAFVVALLVRPAWLLVLVGVTIPFQATAMVVLGASSITVFWGGVLVVAVRALWLLTRPAPARWHTRRLAVLRVVFAVFVGYCVLISVLGPFAFAGLRVFTPRAGMDTQVIARGTLEFGVSSLAQPVYLVLSVLLVVYLVLEPGLRPSAIVPGLLLGIALALLRVAVGEAWPTDVLENMPNIYYAVWEKRARGTFAEPSGLAAFLAAVFGYSARVAVDSTGRRRLGAVAVVVAALVTYVFAGAATGLAGIAGVLALAALLWLAGPALRPVRLPRWSRGAALGAVVVLVAASPLLYTATVGLVQEKSTTSSAAVRGTANAHALWVFAHTGGLGVGLGGNRPSSLAMLLLSTVGVVGTGAFVVIVALAVAGGLRHRATSPVAWALVATLAAGVSSVPDLSLPQLWVFLGLCVRAAGDVGLLEGGGGDPGRAGVPRRRVGQPRARRRSRNSPSGLTPGEIGKAAASPR